MHKIPLSRLIFFPVVISTQLVQAATPVDLTLSAGYINDDNITRAELNSDILKDSILNLTADAAYNIKLNNSSSMNLNGLLVLNQYQDFDKLSNIRLGLGARYLIQPDTAYTAPWYALSVKFQNWEFDNDLRSGTFFQLSFNYAQRLTDKMEIRAGLDIETRDAESIIFDTDNNRLYMSLDLKLSNRNTLYTSLSYNDGDIVSTVQDSSPTTLKLASIPWEIDDAFPSNWWSYKLDAKTYGLMLGDNFSINSKQSFDISLFYYNSSAYAGSDYTGLITELRYFYRF